MQANGTGPLKISKLTASYNNFWRSGGADQTRLLLVPQYLGYNNEARSRRHLKYFGIKAFRVAVNGVASVI